MFSVKSRQSRIKHEGRILHIERLTEECIAYMKLANHQLDYEYVYKMQGERAITRCCSVEPVKFFPDAPSNYERWWLICLSCKNALPDNENLGT